VPAAAHSFSILAKRDESELGFLLNFVDAKQQQHLAQVQSFFDATSVDSIRKEMGAKLGCRDFPCLVLNRSVWEDHLSGEQGTNWLLPPAFTSARLGS